MNAPEKRTDPSRQGNASLDRGVLSALLREIQATHLSVWQTNAGGVLVAKKIRLDEIAAQVRMSGRVAEQNPAEAMKMIQSAERRFDEAARRWEIQSRQSEERLRADTSGKRLNDATARHNAIRTRIVPMQSVFRRAVLALSELTKERR